jgi:hypothetical protein
MKSKAPVQTPAQERPVANPEIPANAQTSVSAKSTALEG